MADRTPGPGGGEPPAEEPQLRIAVLLGSNIDPAKNLPAAVRELDRLGLRLATSGVWLSAPVGFHEQDDFCNAVVLLQSRRSIERLRQDLKAIEDRLGRVRDPANKNAPRTIDLDLALVIDEETELLRIVDPEITERVFVAVPLAEVSPETELRAGGPRLSEVAEELTQRDAVRLRFRRSELSLN